jgi:predicted nucleic acid-binding protein
MRVEELPQAVVVDASVGVKWVVDEPGSDAAVALLAGRTLLTSALFWVEAANALATKERRGELSRAALDDAWRDLVQAPLTSVAVDRTGVATALSLAAELRHPIYDCCYLQLAVQHRTAVITADRRFRQLVAPHAALAARVVHLDEIEAG